MQWQDDGLVLSTRRHGERDAILEVMTKAHGRHFGLVRSGRSPRLSASLQPGNRLSLVWRARLEDHLGAFAPEVLESRAAFILADALALHATAHLGALLRLLPERSPHPALYEAADALCTLASAPMLLAEMLVRFEARILADLGFGLDLTCCAATGTGEDLVYVSPRSGRAVNRDAGAPWAEKLLPLPPFLLGERASARAAGLSDIQAGFRLTGYFLDHHVFEPRAIPPSQARLMVLRELEARG